MASLQEVPDSQTRGVVKARKIARARHFNHEVRGTAHDELKSLLVVLAQLVLEELASRNDEGAQFAPLWMGLQPVIEPQAYWVIRPGMNVRETLILWKSGTIGYIDTATFDRERHLLWVLTYRGTVDAYRSLRAFAPLNVVSDIKRDEKKLDPFARELLVTQERFTFLPRTPVITR